MQVNVSSQHQRQTKSMVYETTTSGGLPHTREGALAQQEALLLSLQEAAAQASQACGAFTGAIAQRAMAQQQS